MSTPKQVLEFCARHEVKFADLRFVDLPGAWQHLTLPLEQLREESFRAGFGLDVATLRGWQAQQANDLLLVPDPAWTILDPFTSAPTLILFANAIDRASGKPAGRDPRGVARRAEDYLQSSGLADAACFAARAEFFIFDNVRFDQRENLGFFYIDAEEGAWNSGREEDNLGYRTRFREGSFPAPPADHYQDLRSDMALKMQAAGLPVESHRHAAATAGQAAIDLGDETLLKSADSLLVYKYIAKMTAYQYGKTVTFMPKPLFQENGSGMRTHQSLWKAGQPLFAGDQYAGLSQTALHYIGGLLRHARALAALVAPTTNSYQRLAPGSESPVQLTYSQHNRAAACGIQSHPRPPQTQRIEFRPPDPACNPYLAFSAMLMAGLDGIKRQLDPGQPLDKAGNEPPADERAHLPALPRSLAEALDELEKDHTFLLEGGVFSPELIATWIEYKRQEIAALQARPHPYEFQLYYDI